MADAGGVGCPRAWAFHTGGTRFWEADFKQGRPGVEAYERIKRILAEHEDDLQKAEGGNKAAGTRVRQAMQDVKNAAQEVRQKILDMRDTSKAS